MMNKKVMTSALVLGLLCSMNVSYAEKELYETYDGQKNGAAVQYSFTEDSLFQVNTKLGNVTDIQLRPGEQVTYIAGGDTTRWLIDKAMVGNIQHVYIKPTVKDISTNIIINTNVRSYRLNVTENGTFVPIIRFWFRDDANKNSKSNSLVAPTSRLSDSVARNYHYKFKAHKKADASLMPEEIYDDGNKTYIRISEKNKYDMPVLYSIDPWSKKMSMVNYRVKDNWFIVDKVMEKGRLLYHQKFWIDFENLKKNKMGSKVVYQEVRGGHVRKVSSDDDSFAGSYNNRKDADDNSNIVPLRGRLTGPNGYTAEQLDQIEQQGMTAEQQEYIRQQNERQMQLEQQRRMEEMRQRKIQETNNQNVRMLSGNHVPPSQDQLRQELEAQREQGRLQMEQDAMYRRQEMERRKEILQKRQEQQRQLQQKQLQQKQVQQPVQQKRTMNMDEFREMLKRDLEENLEKGRLQLEHDAEIARQNRAYRLEQNRLVQQKQQVASRPQVVSRPQSVAPVKVVTPVVESKDARLKRELAENLEQGRLQMEQDAELRRQAEGYRPGIRQQSKVNRTPIVSQPKVQGANNSKQVQQRQMQFVNQQQLAQQRQAQLQQQKVAQQRQAQLKQQQLMQQRQAQVHQQQLAQQRQAQLQQQKVAQQRQAQLQQQQLVQQRQAQLIQQQRQAQLKQQQTAQQRQVQLQDDVRKRTLAQQQRQVALRQQQLEQQRQMELRRQQLLQQLNEKQAVGGNKKASKGAK